MDEEYVLELSEWRTPATAYPRERRGKAAIESDTYEATFYDMYLTPGPEGKRHSYYRFLTPQEITTLVIDGKTWMVDDPSHWYMMVEHARHYRGTVLCAGLGLGLIVHALHANPAVDRIVVVERSADVVALVGPHLPQGKMTVVVSEWEKYTHAGPVDGVLYDLFVGNAFDLLSEAATVYSEIRARYPGAGVVRIHGFSMALVESVAAARLAPFRHPDIPGIF